MRLRFLVLGAAAATSVASSAAAEEQRVVRYHDLELATPRGARLMYSRIDEAAVQICGGGRGSLEAINRAIRRTECWRDATAEAVTRLNAPAVTAVWQWNLGRWRQADANAREPAQKR